MKSLTCPTKHSLKHVTALSLGLLILGVVAAAPALAATSTSNMAVSGSVASSCIIVAGPLSFSAFNPVTGTAVDAEATLTVSCAVGTPNVFITLGQGAHAGGGSTDAVPVRRMVHATDTTAFLSYNLFQETSRTTLWGNTPGTAPAAFTSTGLAQLVTVFGRITATQPTALIGAYTDLVVATVNF
jgi:spore coat protein U domain-containing protein, fimbrial subunit CupE1/2/3/6